MLLCQNCIQNQKVYILITVYSILVIKNMENKQIRIYIEILREAIDNKDWNKVKYVEGLFNMHTIDED